MYGYVRDPETSEVLAVVQVRHGLFSVTTDRPLESHEAVWLADMIHDMVKQQEDES